MILFDAHVHIYDVFNLDLMINSAFLNFSKAMKSLEQKQSECSCYLLLTESAGLDYFAFLSSKTGADVHSFNYRWTLEETKERCSLRVCHPDFPDIVLFIVRGRQVITKERLELLALFTMENIPDDMPLEDCVQQIYKSGGLPVCAWGAGKWLGKRGELLSDFLQSPAGKQLYMGDSGGRPICWPASKLLHLKPFSDRVVSGTDPLALVGEEKRVGSFGGYVAATVSQTMPAASLKDFLTVNDFVVKPFGKSLSPFLFVKNQLALRLRR